MRRWGLFVLGLLFYAAPVGAGMTGASYVAVLPFSGLFFMWVILMKKKPFADGWGAILPSLMIHLALASACLGLGYVIRSMYGVALTAPLIAWLALGLASLAMVRVVWPATYDEELLRYAEQTLKQLDSLRVDMADIEPPAKRKETPAPTPQEAEILGRLMGLLDAEPADGASKQSVTAILAKAAGQVRPLVLFSALEFRCDRTSARRDRLALMIAGFTFWPRGDRVAQAFDQIVAAADVTTLAQFLVQANALLDDMPESFSELPTVARLVDIAEQIPSNQEELTDALVNLARRIEDLKDEHAADE